MTQIETTRRHSDGSLDIDFYRGRMTGQRASAPRAGFLKAASGVVATAMVIGLVTLLASAPHASNDIVAAASPSPSTVAALVHK